MTEDELTGMKRAAAVRAAVEVRDGMVVGLGTGSTAALAIEALGVRVAQGLRMLGIPTSRAAAALARHCGVPLTSFATHRRLDLTIDGADQAERGTLNLVKGLGGALLREKLVASASARMIVVIDRSKLVARLGGATKLPVEVTSFGWQVTLERLAALGCAPTLRRVDGRAFATDGGNRIADCAMDDLADAAEWQARLAAVVGVVESGLFVGLASELMVGGADGVEIISR